MRHLLGGAGVLLALGFAALGFFFGVGCAFGGRAFLSVCAGSGFFVLNGSADSASPRG